MNDPRNTKSVVGREFFGYGTFLLKDEDGDADGNGIDE